MFWRRFDFVLRKLTQITVSEDMPEIFLFEEKILWKALIPLPPTGFVSFFCVNPDVVQTSRQPRQAGVLCGRPAVSQIAKF